MFDQKYKKLIDFPNQYQKSKAYLNEAPRLSFELKPGFWGLRKSKICRKVLDPLIPATKLIIVYDLNTENHEIKKFKHRFQSQRGRHIFELGGQKWENYMPLLYRPNPLTTIHMIRGSIVIKCLNDHVPWNEIFPSCFGPMIVNNPSIGCGKTALSYVKRNFDDEHVFIILEKINSGLDNITISCQHYIADKIFDIAANTCLLPSNLRYDIPGN